MSIFHRSVLYFCVSQIFSKINPNLGGDAKEGGGANSNPLSYFSVNISEVLKAVTVALCNVS